MLIRPLLPASVGLPQGGGEGHHRQEEEATGYLQPHNAARTAEGAEEAARTHLCGTAHVARGDGCLPALRCRIRGARWLRCLRGILVAGCQPLADYTASHTQSYAHEPANDLSSHSDMMVAAIPCGWPAPPKVPATRQMGLWARFLASQ